MKKYIHNNKKPKTDKKDGKSSAKRSWKEKPRNPDNAPCSPLRWM